jgi:ribosomal protein S7
MGGNGTRYIEQRVNILNSASQNILPRYELRSVRVDKSQGSEPSDQSPPIDQVRRQKR